MEEIHQRAADFFVSTSKPVLEVTTDPEVFDSHTLFVLIQTNVALQEALRRLDCFDEEWGLAASERAEGRLCIDVECASFNLDEYLAR